jgi:hypothetical protein
MIYAAVETDWPIFWATLAGAAALVITSMVALSIAIWGDALKRLWYKPRLDVRFHARPPYCHPAMLVKGRTAGQSDLRDHNRVLPPAPDEDDLYEGPDAFRCYYFRIGIANIGTGLATSVQVRMLGLETLDEGMSRFQPVIYFKPLNLRWSHSREVVLKRLEADKSGRWQLFCDLGHIYERIGRQGRRLFRFDAEVEPGPVRPDMWPSRAAPGKYRIQLAITADGLKVTHTTLVFRFKEWFDEEETMFRDGIQEVEVQRGLPPATPPT